MAKKKFTGISEKAHVDYPPDPCGVSRDKNGKFIGKYVYLSGEKDQPKLADLCRSWLKTYAADKNFYLTIDVETQGLDYINLQLLLISISWNGRNSVVFSPYFLWGKTDSTGVGESYELWLEVLRTIPINNQAVKFDLKWFLSKYRTFCKIKFCTMTAAQLAWPGCFPGRLFGLDALTKNLLKPLDISKAMQTSFIGQPVDQQFTNEQVAYAACDTMITHRLMPAILLRLVNQDLLNVWETEDLPTLQSLLKSEFLGITTDREKVEEVYEANLTKCSEIVDKLQEEYWKIPDEIRPAVTKKKGVPVFMPTSPKAIVEVLASVGIKTKGSAREILEELRVYHPHPIIDLILDHKEIFKIFVSTLKGWLDNDINPTTGCFHTNYAPNGAWATGRLSSSPQSQNINEDLRPLWIARKRHKLITADMSQFEFRACAGVTGEQYLIDLFFERAKYLDDIRAMATRFSFIDPDDFVKAIDDPKQEKLKLKEQLTEAEIAFARFFGTLDIHKKNAALIFGIPVEQVTAKQRKICKQLGYALLYGSGVPTIASSLYKEGITDITLKEIGAHRETFFVQLPKVKKFIDEVHADVLKKGYIVNTLGRKRYFDLCPKYMTNLYEKQLADAQREAVNWHFQSRNADALKLAMPMMDDIFEAKFGETRAYNLIKGQIESASWVEDLWYELFGDTPVCLLNVHDEVVVEAHDDIVDETAKIVVDCMIDAGGKSIGYTVPIESSVKIGDHWSK